VPRACALHEGQTGLCFVRMRAGDEIMLTTYGRSSGFCIDPIEKKPLNHFLPGTPVLSFGTAGCNLACRFCQNWDMSKSREMDTLADAASPEQIAEAAWRLGCRSVAFTYNDPVIFMEYATDVADACRERGLKAVAVTAGYMNAGPRAEFYRHMDAANVDLKAFSDDFYHRICAGRLGPVLDTLEYLKHETAVWLEITNLMIPGLNDTPEETDAMTRWIVEHLGPDVPVHFTAFHPDWKLQDRPPTPAETLTRARDRARERHPLCLHRQRPRYRRAIDVLSWMRRRADRARLVRAGRLAPRRARAVRGVPRAVRRRLRRGRGPLGRPPATAAVACLTATWSVAVRCVHPLWPARSIPPTARVSRGPRSRCAA
jgi:pyruvate formate lyase activating enzyme